MSHRGNVHLSSGHLDWYEAVAIPLVASKGAKLVLAVAWAGFNPICPSHPDMHFCQVSEHRDDEALRKATKLAESHEQVAMLDLRPPFCNEGKCGLRVPGTKGAIAYADFVHLRVEGAEYLKFWVCSLLSGAGVL